MMFKKCHNTDTMHQWGSNIKVCYTQSGRRKKQNDRGTLRLKIEPQYVFENCSQCKYCMDIYIYTLCLSIYPSIYLSIYLFIAPCWLIGKIPGRSSWESGSVRSRRSSMEKGSRRGSMEKGSRRGSKESDLSTQSERSNRRGSTESSRGRGMMILMAFEGICTMGTWETGFFISPAPHKRSTPYRLVRKGPESRAQRDTSLRISRLSADSGTLRRSKGERFVQTTGGQKRLCLKTAYDPIWTGKIWENNDWQITSSSSGNPIFWQTRVRKPKKEPAT